MSVNAADFGAAGNAGVVGEITGDLTTETLGTVGAGGAAGKAVDGTPTWIAGNTAARVKGAVG